MQTSGQLLFHARIKSKLTLTQAEALTKIPKATLKALEKNQFSKLPSLTYVQGFIQNYAKVLNLNPQKTLAVFKRDYRQKQSKKILPQGLTQPLNLPQPLSSTTRTIITIVIIAVLLFSYLGLSLYHLYQPPPLTLTQPENGQELKNPVLIKGKTDRDATLTLNNKTVNLDPDGQFTTVYNGSVGTVELKFTATSRRQKSTNLSRHVIIVEWKSNAFY